MSTPAETFNLDGVEWERWHYGPGDDLFQWACEDCDRGLLLAPARECPSCCGRGYRVADGDPRRSVKSAKAEGTET